MREYFSRVQKVTSVTLCGKTCRIFLSKLYKNGKTPLLRVCTAHREGILTTYIAIVYNVAENTRKPDTETAMLKECKTEKSSARQKLIEDALFEMMKKRSYEDITVTDLCEELKMQRKAFYRYFDGKDSALVGYVSRRLASYAEISNASAASGPRSLHREMESYFSFWKTNRELLEVLDKNGKLSLIIEISLGFPIEKIVSLRRLLPDEEDGMRLHVYRFAIGGLISIMVDWFREGFATSKSDMARLAIRILTKPPFPRLDQFGMTV